MRADGTVDKWASPWLSVPLSPAVAPWAFSHGADTFRFIASLEAFAIVLGMRYLVPTPAATDTVNRLTIVPCFTDNKGNGSALTRLYSSRYPLSAIIMEMAEEMRARAITAEVRWAPRAANASSAHTSDCCRLL